MSTTARCQFMKNPLLMWLSNTATTIVVPMPEGGHAREQAQDQPD